MTPGARWETLLVAPNPILAGADASYARRQEGRVGARASSRAISEAISGYETAARALESAEARWKLARALFFRAKYTGLDRRAQLVLFEKARQAGEEAVAILRRRAEGMGSALPENASPSRLAQALYRDPDAAPTYFWAAVAWGEWALAAGRMRAAKTGAAAKVRDYARTVIALDSDFEEGGGYRILGRLHHRAPRIPYVTGWVSRDQALRNLRLAVQTGPENFVNRHFLAEALADGGRPERSEAIRIARQLLADSPSPGHLVEDLAIQDEARRNLLEWSRRGT